MATTKQKEIELQSGDGFWVCATDFFRGNRSNSRPSVYRKNYINERCLVLVYEEVNK